MFLKPNQAKKGMPRAQEGKDSGLWAGTMTANAQLAHWDIQVLLHNEQGLAQSHRDAFAVLPSILYLCASLGCKAALPERSEWNWTIMQVTWIFS